MKTINPSVIVLAVFLAVTPSSAKWLDAEVVTDTATWSHAYHFPKYSEYFAVILEDKDPNQLLRDIEHAVLNQGGEIPPHLINANPLPAGVVQARYNLPRKGADRLVRGIIDKRDVKAFQSMKYEDSGSDPAPNPQELYSKREVLMRACPTIHSQGEQGPTLAAFCRYRSIRVDDVIAAYEGSQNRARLLVAVVAPGIKHTPDPALWSDEGANDNSGPMKDDPKEPGFWKMSQEGHCAAKAEATQITFLAQAAVAATENSRTLIEKHGGHPLLGDCAFPTRLEPGQERSRIASVMDYTVPDKERAALIADIQKIGTIVYNGPLSVLMWSPAAARSAMKVKILKDGLATNPPVFKSVPAFKSLVESEIDRLSGTARAYEMTVNATPTHFVVMTKH